MWISSSSAVWGDRFILFLLLSFTRYTVEFVECMRRMRTISLHLNSFWTHAFPDIQIHVLIFTMIRALNIISIKIWSMLHCCCISFAIYFALFSTKSWLSSSFPRQTMNYNRLWSSSASKQIYVPLGLTMHSHNDCSNELIKILVEKYFGIINTVSLRFHDRK